MRMPLEEVLVVSVEQAVAAPFCTQRLVEAGARVIKVERPEGDFAREYEHLVQGESAYFVWLNRGKESVVLDFDVAHDRDMLERMIARADVFIQNLGPGVAARRGFSSADLLGRYPALVTCEISGYGSSPNGDESGGKAYDLLIQAESGLASVTGRPEGPGRVGISICDIAAGISAYAGVLEALIQRERTGKGTSVSVSLFDTMVDWMTVPMLLQAFSGETPQRLGMHHPSIAPYGAYNTNDGALVVAVQNDREWRRLCRHLLDDDRVTDDPRFRTNRLRVRNRSDLDVILDEALGSLSTATAMSLLRSAEIAHASLNQVSDVWGHPSVRLGTALTSEGEVSLPIPALRAGDEGREEWLGTVPVLDQHGAEIRAEFR